MSDYYTLDELDKMHWDDAKLRRSMKRFVSRYRLAIRDIVELRERLRGMRQPGGQFDVKEYERRLRSVGALRKDKGALSDG